jgi:Zn-finger nucleic acid-binding protein
MVCPNCGGPMREIEAEETYGRKLTVDACQVCQGLWFDGTELLQLSARSTLDLFRSMARAPAPAPPLAAKMLCPRCQAPLVDSADVQRGTRFHFGRCPKGHGRFLTFFQFLRAKNFVRTLSPTELAELRKHIRQINCSNCGAAVDVERGSVCAYCRTPVSVVDPAQLEKTVRALEETDARRQAIDPTLPIRLLEERLRTERAFSATDSSWLLTLTSGDRTVDLVQAGVRALKAILEK